PRQPPSLANPESPWGNGGQTETFPSLALLLDLASMGRRLIPLRLLDGPKMIGLCTRHTDSATGRRGRLRQACPREKRIVRPISFCSIESLNHVKGRNRRRLQRGRPRTHAGFPQHPCSRSFGVS